LITNTPGPAPMPHPLPVVPIVVPTTDHGLDMMWFGLAVIGLVAIVLLIELARWIKRDWHWVTDLSAGDPKQLVSKEVAILNARMPLQLETTRKAITTGPRHSNRGEMTCAIVRGARAAAAARALDEGSDERNYAWEPRWYSPRPAGKG
jgi:hypothetical protein